MTRSTDRILTTHVGSLVRPLDVQTMVMEQVAGRPVDEAKFQAAVRQAVKDVVAKQAEVGVDIPSDGEFSKHTFIGYVAERLGGLSEASAEQAAKAAAVPGAPGGNYPILQEEFPGFMKQYNGMFRSMWLHPEIPKDLVDAALGARGGRHVVTGPITYKGYDELNRDIDNLKNAVQGHDFADVFLPSATPSRSDADPSGIYKTAEEYLYALADAMHEEYKAIVDAGFLVQLDLGLPARNQVLPGNPHPSPEDLRRASMMQVEAYNHALRGIPQDRVRYHLCWGSMNTPHTSDIPLREFIDIILAINAGAYVIEAANPRHEHEWKVWEDVKLPQDKILVPGVVSHQTNVVEHPELIAMRLQNYASVVDREQIMAGSDCGFSQGWNTIRVHPEVQWAKLKAMAEGAALASKALWS